MNLSQVASIGVVLVTYACGGGGSSSPTAPSLVPLATERPSLNNEVFPEVWSSNGFDGQTYEFKTNCFGNFVALETCFLWTVTAVIVESPDGVRFELEKDFNINTYSGEVTRRWVLYGPPGAGLPKPGEYWFLYQEREELVLTQIVSYYPETVDPPTSVTWSREGNDLVVGWTPPAGAMPGMWYKVLIFPDGGDIISDRFEWDARSARLLNVPLVDGATGRLNVAIYFSGGYAYSEYLSMTW